MIPAEAAIQLYLWRRERRIDIEIHGSTVHTDDCCYTDDDDDSWLPEIEIIHCKWCGWIADILQGQNPRHRDLCSGCRDLINYNLMDQARACWEAKESARKDAARLRKQEADRRELRATIAALERQYPATSAALRDMNTEDQIDAAIAKLVKAQEELRQMVTAREEIRKIEDDIPF